MKESAVSFPSCISTDAPFWSSCLPTRSFRMGGIPLMISWFWRSMMDCGNDGGRVPRPVLPKVCNQTGGGNSFLEGQVCRGRQLPKCRPARVANRSWSRKRVGMRGRGKEQWLARINGWATYQGSMDGKVCPVVQQSVDLLWVQVTTSVECTKSIKILPVPGRSYGHGREGTHRSSNQPVKTDGHSSLNKINLWRNDYENCIWPKTF
jgi:hypothetical protein